MSDDSRHATPSPAAKFNGCHPEPGSAKHSNDFVLGEEVDSSHSREGTFTDRSKGGRFDSLPQAPAPRSSLDHHGKELAMRLQNSANFSQDPSDGFRRVVLDGDDVYGTIEGAFQIRQGGEIANVH